VSKQRYSIIPGDFAEEERADGGHFRVLTLIGRHTDRHGWCRLKQITIGEAVGLTRETVCRKLKDLVAWGYVEKRAQDATGRAIYYRTIMDRPQPLPPVDEADLDDEGEAGEGCETSPRPVSDGSHVDGTCAPRVTSGVSAKITSGVRTAITQNDPSLTTEGKYPNPNGARAVGAKDETSDRECKAEAAKLLEALRADGVAQPVVDHLLRPILEGKRFSSTDRLGRLRELRDSAKGIPTPALDKAAEIVLKLEFRTIKPERIAEAIEAVRKGGAMVPIRKGTPQWAAWFKYLEANEPQNAKLMQRFDGWQVRAPWPPGHKPASKTEAA
jgi:DNA-binding transcriptional ArsR family regulator